MDEQEALREYVKNVMLGNLGAADFLYPYLPKVDYKTNGLWVSCNPADNSFSGCSVSGEIHNESYMNNTTA